MGVRLLLCSLSTLAALIPTSAWACTCGRFEPAREVRNATAVFHGRALSIETSGSERQRIRFEVLASWKGPVDRELSVGTVWNSDGCGVPFELGREYLVFAGPPTDSSQPTDTLENHICSSNIIENAADDLKYLEAGSTRMEGKLRHFSPGLSCASVPEGMVPTALLALVALASRRMRRFSA